VQTILISGNVGGDAVTRSTQRGDKVTSFNVGVQQGWGEQKQTNWYRCNVWGDRGEKIAQYLLKGVKAFVTGELSIGEYQGKPQYEVRVNEVEWERRQGEARPTDSSAMNARSQPRDAVFAGDLDDDCPF
jgi:single-strand DNA-binding protein